jgi:hypothetical protein
MFVSVVALSVTAAAIARAIGEHSLEPIWTIGWIPAVLIASIGRPNRRGDCVRRLQRRPGS